jgi:hypothetical protein
MSRRLDITSRDLNQGQNDSAAAQRLEFPGFKRSWNTRGRRETARRRRGWTESSPYSSVSQGVVAMAFADALAFVTMNQVLCPQHRENFTYDIAFMLEGGVFGDEVVMGEQVRGNGLMLIWVDASAKVHITVRGLGGSHTFTSAQAIEIGAPIFIRVAGDENNLYCYFGWEAEQAVSKPFTWPNQPNVMYLNKDQLLVPAEPKQVMWFRGFNDCKNHRGGINQLYPRPRDKGVTFLYMSETVPDPNDGAGGSYITDQSRWQNHQPWTNKATGGGLHHQMAQFGGEQPVLNAEYPMIVDGDLVTGRTR